ncbi:MAG: Bro-N domain-containing protein [Candidatus Gracilibacteria bacterium]|nr:Bro-N domain-containing protein [Candidatus Gracilibacteria bacterium]
MTDKIDLFHERKIRKTTYKNEWWFVIEDVVQALTDSIDPKGYIKDLRRRDEEISKGWGQIATPLPIITDGGQQNMNCANTEGIFRIIQSIPSPKAEPFKRWLAKVKKPEFCYWCGNLARTFLTYHLPKPPFPDLNQSFLLANL